MEQTFKKVEDLAGHVKEYINTHVTSAKITAAEKSSRIIANAIARGTVAVILLIALIFLSISGAFVLANWVGSLPLGFLFVGLFYLVTGILIWLTRERLLRFPIMNSILRQLFKEETEDEED